MRVGLVGNLLSLVKNALLLLLLLRLFATFVSGSSVRRSFAFNDFGCNAIAIVSCFLVISRQNGSNRNCGAYVKLSRMEC